jgi:lysophospholipase L1-like esterase
MVVAFGDSITFGQYLAPADPPWPALIEGHDVVAAGVPSDTTRLGLERFPKEVQARLPEVVVIQFGHNDCNRWDTDRGLPRVSPDAYRANLAEMVARCRMFTAVPLLCTITPTTRSKRHAEDTEVYNRILREVAADDFVDLIDVRSIFEAWAADRGEDDASLLLDDGLHLSPTGHRVYAAAVQRALDAHSPR